jgi:hypothetical protein
MKTNKHTYPSWVEWILGGVGVWMAFTLISTLVISLSGVSAWDEWGRNWMDVCCGGLIVCMGILVIARLLPK